MSHISVNFLVVGDTGVGKSSIIASFFREKIQPIHLPTRVLNASHCTFAFSSKEVEAYICDLPGSEHFRPIVSCFYPGAAAILLVFDLINKHTFNNLPRWMHDIRENLPAHSVVVLIGNKSDLEKARVLSPFYHFYKYFADLKFPSFSPSPVTSRKPVCCSHFTISVSTLPLPFL
ncbi:ras-related protein Rab-2A isoform X2 [Penaeus vannamei]|uniref:ras-related protein Rab-2A isoform X2 n=1 Tax=Penaeus vannamei TaxID=6689 RepID=UPI00387F6591